MPGMFLEPETTFSVSLEKEGKAMWKVVEGGAIHLMTLRGREHAKLMKAIRNEDIDAQYDILKGSISKGITDKELETMHANAVMVLLFEVAKRSHVAETEAGN